MILIKNIRLFDGVSTEIKRFKNLLIKGEYIIDFDVDEKQLVKEKYYELDLMGYYLMPGLVDCHLHLFLEEIPDIKMNDQLPGGTNLPNVDAYITLRSVKNAYKTLEAGITTVSDGGAINYSDVALREAIQLGVVSGPRYHICGQQITSSSGHFNGIAINASGPWEMRKAVRSLVWWGVNHIKIKMSAPIRIPGRDPGRSEFTVEEVSAAVDEAHRAGLKVSAHARGKAPIIDALEAGVDIIVHGTGIDEKGIELMIKRGSYLFPTLYSPPLLPDSELKKTKSKTVLDDLKYLGKLHWCSIEKAYQAGVKMAMSTDAGGLSSKHGENSKEILRMKEIGMSNLECLTASTSVAAEALNMYTKIGKIDKGYYADLIVLKENPIEKLETVTNVLVVIKGGKIYKNILNDPIAKKINF